jgi:hypothetical protein
MHIYKDLKHKINLFAYFVIFILHYKNYKRYIEGEMINKINTKQNERSKEMKKIEIPEIKKTEYRVDATLEVKFNIGKLWVSNNLDPEEAQAKFVEKLERAINSIDVGENMGMLGCADIRNDDPKGREFLPEGVNTNQVKSVKVIAKKVTSEHTL